MPGVGIVPAAKSQINIWIGSEDVDTLTLLKSFDKKFWTITGESLKRKNDLQGLYGTSYSDSTASLLEIRADISRYRWCFHANLEHVLWNYFV